MREGQTRVLIRSQLLECSTPKRSLPEQFFVIPQWALSLLVFEAMWVSVFMSAIKLVVQETQSSRQLELTPAFNVENNLGNIYKSTFSCHIKKKKRWGLRDGPGGGSRLWGNSETQLRDIHLPSLAPPHWEDIRQQFATAKSRTVMGLGGGKKGR